MGQFENGFRYGTCFQLTPPRDRPVPWVGGRNQIKLVGPSGKPHPIPMFKFDIGARRTVLTKATARALGIRDLRRGSVAKVEMNTASGAKLTGWVHSIQVVFLADFGPEISIHLNAVFCAKVRHDLFGADWVRSISAPARGRERLPCVVFDQDCVTLLWRHAPPPLALPV